MESSGMPSGARGAANVLAADDDNGVGRPPRTDQSSAAGAFISRGGVLIVAAVEGRGRETAAGATGVFGRFGCTGLAVAGAFPLGLVAALALFVGVTAGLAADAGAVVVGFGGCAVA